MDTKKCSHCKEVKPLAEYYRKNQSQCKKCHYFFTNERRKKVTASRKEFLLQYKGYKCQHCHNKFPEICYDFHHIDPKEKEFQFNQLNSYSMQKLIKEVDKCILLCSNCHRIEHQRLRYLKKKESL